MPGYAGQLKAGSIRGIGVASERRLPQLPDIPTYTESGFPIVASTWVGIFAPARTDAAILQRLNVAVNDVLREASTRANWQPCRLSSGSATAPTPPTISAATWRSGRR